MSFTKVKTNPRIIKTHIFFSIPIEYTYTHMLKEEEASCIDKGKVVLDVTEIKKVQNLIRV